MQALQTLALMGADAGHAAPGAPARQAPSADLSNMAALLALDNVAAAQRQALCPQVSGVLSKRCNRCGVAAGRCVIATAGVQERRCNC